MKRNKLGILGALALAVMLVVGVAALPSQAQEDPPPIAVEPLTPRSSFEQAGSDFRAVFKVKMQGAGVDTLDLKDPSLTQVMKITIQPGAVFPWHTHPGPVIVNIVEGEFVYVPANECVHRTYLPGAALVDPGRGHVHTAYNPGDEPTVVVATFFELPAQGPATIPVDPPTDCEL